MRLVSLEALRDRVRVQTDTENAQRPTDQQLRDYINASISALHATLADGGASLLLKSHTLTTASGTSKYALTPSDSIWQLRSVVRELSSTTHEHGMRFDDLERGELAQLRWRDTFRYQLSGILSDAPQIEFLPAPDETCTVKIGYIPSPTELVLDSDAVACLPGWERWIVLDASIPILIAEETDATMLMALRDQVWSREILPATRSRDSASRRMVLEVE